jgi:hypothetical protein
VIIERLIEISKRFPLGLTLALPLLCAMALTLVPRSDAHGACISNTAVPQFDPGSIPVYVSSDGLQQTRISNVGLGPPGQSFVMDEEIRWIKAAIDIVNSASTGAPRLYYAGTDSSVAPLNTSSEFSSVNPGITLSVSGACGYQLPTSGWFAVQDAGAGANANKSRIYFIRGGEEACANFADPDYHWWVDPDDDDGDPGTVHDFVGVAVHELLHSLGLGHTNDPNVPPPAYCDVAFPYSQSLGAVMYTGNKDFRRRLRRDDIEGLRLLYGSPARRVYESRSTAVPATSASWSVPVGIYPATLRANTPVSLSNGARNSDVTMLAGFTNASDQVGYFTGTWAGWDANANGGTAITTPLGASITTYDRVVVARGTADADPQERRIAAWIGSSSTKCCSPEQTPSMDVRIHWRVQENGTWLTPQSAGPTRYKNLGVGYDPKEDLFVLALIDTYPTGSTLPGDQRLFVRTINAASGGGGCTQALTTVDHVLAVGDVACDYVSSVTPTRCVIPVATTSEDSGPELRFVEGEIRPHDGFVCFVRDATPEPPLTVAGALALGGMSGAIDGYANAGWFLGSHVPGFSGTTPATSDYAYVFAMERTPQGDLTGVMTDATTFVTDSWPLHVGSMARTSPSPNTQWRAITYGP